MIRINLLHGASRKIHRRLTIPPRAVALLIVLVLAGGLVWQSGRIIRYVKPFFKKAPVAVQKSAPPAVKPAVNKHTIIEEVVADVADSQMNLHESGLLKISYQQLSFAEKINYEWLYARKSMDLLSRVVPAGVGLRTLEISEFQTLSGAGISPTREAVSLFLAQLGKEEGVTLSRDFTSITSHKSQGFKFMFLCTTEFGLNLTDPAVDLSLSSLPRRTDLPALLDSLQVLAERATVVLTRKPEQVAAQRLGNFYQFSYAFSTRASYKNMAQLITLLSKTKFPAAFSKLSITAVSPGVVTTDAVIRVTTSERQ